MSENPIKHKKCPVCKKLTYYNPSMPYQKAEERNPLICAYCGAYFSKREQLQTKIKHRNPDTFSQPFYAVNHVNLACIGIKVKNCPCFRSWLCDGIWGNKQSMSNPYDAEQQKMREENFGEN